MKINILTVFYLLVIASLISACGGVEPTETSVSISASVVPHTSLIFVSLESEGLLTYQGDGYAFKYPLNSRLEIVEPQPPAINKIQLLGPDVSIKPADGDWSYSGPGYRMTIEIYDNPDLLDAESWGRTHLTSIWEDLVAQDLPIGPIPVSEEGVINEDDVGTTEVGGYPAFWIEWFGGDSAIMAYYVDLGSQILCFKFNDYPLQNQPINEIQQGVYTLIMSTLRISSD